MEAAEVDGKPEQNRDYPKISICLPLTVGIMRQE